jgi:hypothetical protein
MKNEEDRPCGGASNRHPAPSCYKFLGLTTTFAALNSPPKVRGSELMFSNIDYMSQGLVCIASALAETLVDLATRRLASRDILGRLLAVRTLCPRLLAPRLVLVPYTIPMHD